MNLRFLSLLAVSAALVSGSLTAAAAPHKHSRAISQAQAVKIAKKRVGGGRVTDIDHSDGRWEIEIRRGRIRCGRFLTKRPRHQSRYRQPLRRLIDS